MTKMIPPVPTSAVMLPTPKQKIGFSIASIVGNDAHTVGAGGVVDSGANNTNNNNNSCKIMNNGTNNLTDVENDQKNNNTLNNTTNGPTSPPQTPPTNVNMTQMPLNTPSSAHPAHIHFTAAQQHAIQQHLLMQQHHQQQQQQQQQQHHQHFLQQQQNAKTQDIQDLIQRLHNTAAAAAHLSQPAIYSSSPAQTRISPCHDESPTSLQIKRSRSPLPDALEHAQNPAQRLQPPHTPPKSESPQSSTHATPPPLPPPPSMSVMPKQFLPKPAAMLMPGMTPAGLVRPFPMGHGGPPPGTPTMSPQGGPGGPQQGMPDIKALPPYINAPPELPPQHPNQHLFAAAQFQMAAALQAGHVLGAAGLPPHAGPFMPGPGMPRDSYPLYPWLLSRHGRLFPHRFPGNFLLQPFRKPKRIRTAFSPSQLLKLEHAFESNQYVVGAERKALAQSLNLSETQVKVWFQNRRTKHKRMQQEDEKGGSGNGSSGDRNSQNTSFDEEDDELIDMEMDDCPSDEEQELDASH